MRIILPQETNENNSSTMRIILKVHEGNFKELINSNLDSANECLDMLSSEIGILTASLGISQRKLAKT